jgi:hypothetical protein
LLACASTHVPGPASFIIEGSGEMLDMTDETREALVKLAQAVDRLAFGVAGLAAYIAHLPGADEVHMAAAKETARALRPETVYRGIVPPLIVEAYAIMDRVEAHAKSRTEAGT